MSATETRRPRSGPTVSVGWDEGEDLISRSTSRLHIDLAECVETKTVTTTTTTKRSYPPILLRHKPLQSLDTKEYPLAANPTPPELTHISYEIDGQLVNFSEEDCATRTDEVCQIHFIFPNRRRTFTKLLTISHSLYALIPHNHLSLDPFWTTPPNLTKTALLQRHSLLQTCKTLKLTVQNDQR